MSDEPRVLAPEECAVRLAAVGIPHVRTLSARDPQAAARLVDPALGPWVLKAGGLVHKSDGGGVITDLDDAEAVRRAGEDMVRRLGPAAAPLQLQQQVTGTEVLVGLRRDHGTGAVVVLGMGGVHAEVLDDTAVALVPLSEADVRAMVPSLRGAPLLTGHRGSVPVDLDALHQIIAGMSALAERYADLVEVDLNPVIVAGAGAGATAVDVRMVAVEDPPPQPIRSTDISRPMSPDRIAVAGVSDDPGKVGGRIFRHLRQHGFPGRVDAVHPSGGTVDGHPRLRSLDELEEGPDLVCIAVPAAHVLEVARAAVRVGAGGILVHSAGFGESGPAGRQAQAELLEIARAAGVPLLGPNSMGIVSPARGLAASLSGTLRLPSLRAGGISIISTSGALSSCLASRLWERGGGIATWVSAGNEADVDLASYLRWIAEDDDTTTVGLIVESLTDGERFIDAARAVRAAGKSLFAFSPGRTELGREAAISHTGAMVGSHLIRSHVLAAGGAVVVDDLITLEDALLHAEAGGLPAGPRLGVITGSGGACAIIADACEVAGLDLPPFPSQTTAHLTSLLPSFAAVANPLDVTAHVLATPEMFGPVVAAATGSDVFDALLVQFTTNADPSAEVTAQEVIEISRRSPIPIFVSRYGAHSIAPRGVGLYAQAGIPLFDTPEEAITAIGVLARAGTAAVRPSTRPPGR